MPSTNHSPIDEAHYIALRAIINDARHGLIPCQDYIITLYEALGKEATKPDGALLDYLNNSKRLLLDSEAFKQVQDTFLKYGVTAPIGLEDMPLYWGRAFERALDEINWVEPCPEETLTCFGWDFLQQMGAYLAIQFPRGFETDDPEWPRIGAYLEMLHRFLEPGPFTPPARLCEFFDVSR